jgi:hypothetical protein
MAEVENNEETREPISVDINNDRSTFGYNNPEDENSMETD